MGPANVKVIHAHEFVRARPEGVLDLETSEDRGALPDGAIRPGAFLALLADSKGFDVEAFTSYEEAVTWISGEEA